MFDDVLGGILATVVGARCVVLAGRDGVVVAAAVAEDGPAPDVVAASLASLFRDVATAHRDAGLAPPKEFASRGAVEQAAIREVTPEYLLIAVVHRDASLGRLRFELGKAATAVEPELL